jgi:hypothetical protein
MTDTLESPNYVADALSPDDLVLFDALFDRWLPPSALVREGFSERLGLNSAHKLAGTELEERLVSLRRKSLIKIREGARTSLTLTARGGALWEVARRPQWHLYCEDTQHQVGEKWILRIRAVNEEPAEAFVIAAAECGLYTFGQLSRPHWKRSRMMLTPWKRIECLSGELALAPNVKVVDWVAYERRRRWWRTVDELQTLPAGLPG